MSDKPSYLGLLNAIGLNGRPVRTTIFKAGSPTTPDPDVSEVLRTFAAREGEHGMTFAKRINELGFEVLEKDDQGLEDEICLSPDISDIDKFERFGLHELEKLSYFDDIFKDHSIDILTGELLGRYVAEEHDSCRLLRSCYDRLVARSQATSDAQTS